MDSQAYDWTSRVGLIVGFFALSIGLYAALTHPAESYEVSIYAATPPAFWGGVGTAFLLALAVSFSPGSVRNWCGALLLGGFAITSVVALPLVRSYYFYGHADALTHLGWTRGLGTAGSELSVWEIIYPGIHSVAVLLSGATGLPITRSLVVTVLLFPLVCFAFVPLILRAATGSRRATTIGAFSAFLLLPITTLSTHLHAHPFTQTMLFSTAALFLAFKYVTTGDGGPLAWSPTGGLLALVLLAIVIYHPQGAVSLLVVFTAICLLQFVSRKWQYRVADFRSLYGHTVLLGVAVVLWIVSHPAIHEMLWRRVRFVALFLFGELPPGESTASQAGSLSAIGVGLGEMFGKLLLAPTIYGVLGGLLVLGLVVGYVTQVERAERRVATYLTAGSVTVLLLFVVTFLGSINEQYFRYMGLLGLFATILGALALNQFSDRLDSVVPFDAARAIPAVVIALLLPLALLSLYPSPYIYTPTQHVTEAQMTGHGDAFRYTADDAPIADLRGYHSRYHDAIYGVDESGSPSITLEGGTLSNVSGQFDGDGYLVLTRADYEREVDAYHQLRFSRSGFDSLDTQHRANRVISNRDLTMYQVDGRSD